VLAGFTVRLMVNGSAHVARPSALRFRSQTNDVRLAAGWSVDADRLAYLRQYWDCSLAGFLGP
jgi:hypothetical protein